MAITVYSSEACVQCTATKKSLDKANLEYQEFNIHDYDEIVEDLVKRQMTQLPYVVFEMPDGEKVELSGFRPERIRELAKSFS